VGGNKVEVLDKSGKIGDILTNASLAGWARAQTVTAPIIREDAE
jgi:hypothetical protein